MTSLNSLTDQNIIFMVTIKVFCFAKGHCGRVILTPSDPIVTSQLVQKPWRLTNLRSPYVATQTWYGCAVSCSARFINLLIILNFDGLPNCVTVFPKPNWFGGLGLMGRGVVQNWSKKCHFLTNSKMSLALQSCNWA